VAEVRELNPELRRWTTPVPRPQRPSYEIKVPKGTAGAVEQRLAELTPADLATLNRYTVRRGDTIATIARKLGVGRTELADANYLSVKSVVTPGQRLIIPLEPALLLAGRPDRPVPPAESRVLPTSGQMMAKVPAAESTDRIKLTYLVRPGDTLSSVARLYETTVASLKAWNGLTSDLLLPGVRLTIFAARNYQRR
jgi:LysM repeat protein